MKVAAQLANRHRTEYATCSSVWSVVPGSFKLRSIGLEKGEEAMGTTRGGDDFTGGEFALVLSGRTVTWVRVD